MGEVFEGPGFRICSRSGCKWPATASLSFNYATRETWLEELRTPPELTHYDICNIHAGRFRPPHGWTLEDRRGIPMRTSRPVLERVAPIKTEVDDRWGDIIEPPEDALEPPEDRAESLVRPSLLDHSPEWRPHRIKPSGGGGRGPAAHAIELGPIETLDPPKAGSVQAAFPET
jgi:hypothetical protein